MDVFITTCGNIMLNFTLCSGRSDTRWSSTYAIEKKYFLLLDFLDRDDEDIIDLLPSPSMNKKLNSQCKCSVQQVWQEFDLILFFFSVR